MLTRVLSKLPGEIVRTATSLDLKVPSDYPTKRLESLTLALSAWYAKHFITTTSTIKSSKKTTRLILILKDDFNGH